MELPPDDDGSQIVPGDAEIQSDPPIRTPSSLRYPHVRRRILEIQDSFPEPAKQGLDLLVERALRDPLLGRKNFYGSKSKRGLEVASLYYTVLHSAKFAGVEPKEYLRQAIRAALQGQPVPLPHEIIR